MRPNQTETDARARGRWARCQAGCETRERADRDEILGVPGPPDASGAAQPLAVSALTLPRRPAPAGAGEPQREPLCGGACAFGRTPVGPRAERSGRLGGPTRTRAAADGWLGRGG